MMSLGIFVGAVHINTDEAVSKNTAVSAFASVPVMGRRATARMRRDMMDGSANGGTPDTLPGGIDNNTGTNNGTSGDISGENDANKPNSGENDQGGIMGDDFPNGGADAPGDSGILNPEGDASGDNMTPPADNTDSTDTKDTTNDILPDTNVPDTDIGGAVEDSDNDGISDPKDTDDDGDGLPDAVDPDADGDKVDDTSETTGIVGIIIAVIIVVAVIAVIFALMPKKKK